MASHLVGRRFGKWVIKRYIGSGGMGDVYEAHDTVLDIGVALKILRRDLLTDQEFVRQFLNEARVLARLNHRRIVRVFDFIEVDGRPTVVMDFVQGTPLHMEIRRAGRIGSKRALQILRDVAEALDDAHRNGLVHLDVKPSNIIVDKAGHATLTDFGLARQIHRIRERSGLKGSGLPGMRFGTPRYMAPELWWDSYTAEPQSDQYSLALVAYEMLSGMSPFDAHSTEEWEIAHKRGLPRSICEVNPRLPKAIDVIMAKALAKRPKDRFLSVSEFVGELEQELRKSLIDMLEEWAALLLLAASLALVCALLLVIVAFTRRHTPDRSSGGYVAPSVTPQAEQNGARSAMATPDPQEQVEEFVARIMTQEAQTVVAGRTATTRAAIGTPTWTPSPRASDLPTPTVRPAVSLLAPANGAELQGQVTFSWTYGLALGSREVYDVRIAKCDGCFPMEGKTNTTDTTWHWRPGEGEGTYTWQVVVIRREENGHIVDGAKSEISRFVWRGG